MKPEDPWSCIADLSAEDILKSVVIEEKKFKNIESERFGTFVPLVLKASGTHLLDCIYQLLYHRLQ